ncbi:hypothetical protein MLD38_004796 [Melastoma candidum]|uniref:Uncharacterized protein n=1 Tax=Melastoma candidum TaxID=119954 RepID=A0ACB9S7A3_9MYRT|nr:hypothetical protein MLD38_004796 [Melastoma candidum]
MTRCLARGFRAIVDSGRKSQIQFTLGSLSAALAFNGEAFGSCRRCRRRCWQRCCWSRVALLAWRKRLCTSTEARSSSARGTRSSSTPAVEESTLSSGSVTWFASRFEWIKFRRPQEYSNVSSGLVQAIVFEVEDGETIGGSAYGGQSAVCCTADLAKLGVCTEGRIIYRPSPSNPIWRYVFGVAFGIVGEVATLQGKSIPITKTGMYNLYSFTVIRI